MVASQVFVYEPSFSVDELAGNILRLNPCLLSGGSLLTFWHYSIETTTTSSKGSAIRIILIRTFYHKSMEIDEILRFRFLI